MISAVPADEGETTPVEELIVAVPLDVLHVPPVGVALSVVVEPKHTLAVPVIAGNVLTVTVMEGAV